MLEKVGNSKVENALIFRNIGPDSSGTGLCYVVDGQHKMSRRNKPFITLYLRDIEGAVIPGYIFDVDDFKRAGIDLTQTINSVVQITYEENYLPRYGLSVRLTKVSVVVDPPIDMLRAYTGSVDDVRKRYDDLMALLSKELSMGVTIPYSVCTMHHLDYADGKTGGLALHYWEMGQVLSMRAHRFNQQERRQLFGVFVLFIFAHSNYLAAEAKGSADIQLVTQLTAMISQYMKGLRVNSGAIEVVHMFFGYQPKDIYVRLIAQVSEELVRAGKEINLWRTLPTTREGNAGYGTIRRYADEG